MPFKHDLERRLKREIRIENDANCFALSEAINGAAAGAQLVFGVILGTGVGGGIVFNQQVIRGRHHIAGEWGHNQFIADGPVCYCGKRGCVETLLSGPGLMNNYHTGLKDSYQNPEQLFSRAEDGDKTAETVVERYLSNLAKALAQVINIVDPDVVVLGGGISNASCIYKKIPTMMTPWVFSDFFETPIVQNRHGDSSGILGAANLWASGE